MAKKFDIHEWQDKQRLSEQDDFTPDLEDDELKRGAIRQMLDKEKPQTPQDVPQGTLNNAIADLAEIYSYGEILDALKVFYTDNGEQPFADMAKKHAKEFREFLDNEDELDEGSRPLYYGDEELDEQNVTGTGASFNAGDGAEYATPNAFAGDEDDWKNKNTIYEEEDEEEQEEPDQLSPDKLGRDGEIEPDVSYVQNILTSKINTPEEWEELFYTLIDHSGDVKGLSPSTIKNLLQQSIREI